MNFKITNYDDLDYDDYDNYDDDDEIVHGMPSLSGLIFTDVFI